MSVSLLASSALARAPLAVLPLAGGDAPPQPVLSAGALLALAAAAIAILLVLVIKAKMSAFIAMLLVSMGLALATRIPVGDVVKTMTDGMGKTLGTVAMIVGLGAILGRVVEAAGGAETLADRFTRVLGRHRVIAAVTAASFVLGIPIFFDVGFIILAPIVFGFAYIARINPLKIGLPVAATLMALHVVVPPHPGPVASAATLGVDVGMLTMVALPVCAVVAVVSYFASRLFDVDTIVLEGSPLGSAKDVAEAPYEPGGTVARAGDGHLPHRRADRPDDAGDRGADDGAGGEHGARRAGLRRLVDDGAADRRGPGVLHHRRPAAVEPGQARSGH